mmetsp:Transcript_9620/g.14849  ORF Transcript_9620/g.14849 Transcript_9620/m.14849 type:complete len:118 (-) Transcript_9620:461-814(-)
MLTTDMLSPNMEDTKIVTIEILKGACTRSWDELSASSWAVILVTSHKNNVNKVGAGEMLCKALSSASVIQRLQMGLRSLMDKSVYRVRSLSSNQIQNHSVGKYNTSQHPLNNLSSFQ